MQSIENPQKSPLNNRIKSIRETRVDRGKTPLRMEKRAKKR
jgi:hypothetical protein